MIKMERFGKKFHITITPPVIKIKCNGKYRGWIKTLEALALLQSQLATVRQEIIKKVYES